jgi:hypothetical protein
MMERFPIRTIFVPVKASSYSLLLDVEVFRDTALNILESLRFGRIFADQMSAFMPTIAD